MIVALSDASSELVTAHLRRVEHCSVFAQLMSDGHVPALDGAALASVLTRDAVGSMFDGSSRLPVRAYQSAALIVEVRRLITEGILASEDPEHAPLRDGYVRLSSVDALTLPAWVAAADLRLELAAQFTKVFVARGIDGAWLVAMSPDELTALGVGNAVDRAALRAAVETAVLDGVDGAILAPTVGGVEGSNLLPLASLDTAQAMRFLETAMDDLSVFVTAFAALSPPLSGALLAGVTREWLKEHKIGRTYQHRMLLAAVAAALREGGVRPRRVVAPVEPPQLARLKSGDFKTLRAGDVDAPMWTTADSAACSSDGATGVIFVNTAAGGFVCKASQYCAGEATATALALALGLPAARVRLVSFADVEHSAIKSAIYENSASGSEVRMKLHSTFNRPVIMVIELVEEAELLCGMPVASCAATLDATTESGARRLAQLGEMIAFDALINNSDRVPVVHGNQGNARNVIFSHGPSAPGGGSDAASDVVAIDQCITSLSASSAVGAKLYAAYKARVGSWLAACLRYGANAETEGGEVGGGDADISDAWRSARASGETYFWQPSTGRSVWSLPEGAALAPPSLVGQRSTPPTTLPTKHARALMGRLQCEFEGLDDDVAEACVRAAGYDAGLAMHFAQNPELLAYARLRGPGAGANGSLLCVRDFIIRNTACDIGDAGLALIRGGICTFARRVATMERDVFARARANVAAQVEVDWKGVWKAEMDAVRLAFLYSMHDVFVTAVEAIDGAAS